MASRLNSRYARVAGNSLAAATLLGAGVLTYSLIEAQSYRLRRAAVPVLPEDQEPLQILHLSDFHMTPQQRGKRNWVRELSSLEPDFVVVTGDFMAHRDAIGSIITALGPLLDIPGAFVFGSNDYFSPTVGNPLAYLMGPSERRTRTEPDLPWEDLASSLVSCGWADLSNRTETIKVAGRVIEARGVDDPHIRRDRYELVAGPYDAAADLALAVTHAPYRRVLDPMAYDGADLILAGHTHGGQVCVPGYGALVTNCDLETRRAKGLHRHYDSWLHVSAGVGTNPYMQIRLACPPEATLLTLIPRSCHHD